MENMDRKKKQKVFPITLLEINGFFYYVVMSGGGALPSSPHLKSISYTTPLFVDVVDVAVSTPGFKTLVKLVTDLGLVDTLKKAKEVTAFAPTDEAFDKLPKGTLDKLTKEQAKKIVLT